MVEGCFFLISPHLLRKSKHGGNYPFSKKERLSLLNPEFFWPCDLLETMWLIP